MRIGLGVRTRVRQNIVRYARNSHTAMKCSGLTILVMAQLQITHSLTTCHQIHINICLKVLTLAIIYLTITKKNCEQHEYIHI